MEKELKSIREMEKENIKLKEELIRSKDPVKIRFPISHTYCVHGYVYDF